MPLTCWSNKENKIRLHINEHEDNALKIKTRIAHTAVGQLVTMINEE